MNDITQVAKLNKKLGLKISKMKAKVTVLNSKRAQCCNLP